VVIVVIVVNRSGIHESPSKVPCGDCSDSNHHIHHRITTRLFRDSCLNHYIHYVHHGVPQGRSMLRFKQGVSPHKPRDYQSKASRFIEPPNKAGAQPPA
jgi:hypothetical protein